MLGDGSCRVLLYLLGYVVPSYSCFKALEQEDSGRVKEWCVYWLLLALFTTVERLLLDWSIFWLPLYYEAKLLFVLYLWHPRTQGAMYLYVAYVQPFLVGHEATVDQYIQEARTWVSDYLVQNFQWLTKVIQTKAHTAFGALQTMQYDKAERPRVERKESRKAQGQPKASRSRKMSVDDLPAVPTYKIE